MTERARRERRQRQARLRQVRRRRAVALLAASALAVLVASLTGALSPAWATSDASTPGAAEAPATSESGEAEEEGCPEGEVEVEGECDAPAEEATEAEELETGGAGSGKPKPKPKPPVEAEEGEPGAETAPPEADGEDGGWHGAAVVRSGGWRRGGADSGSSRGSHRRHGKNGHEVSSHGGGSHPSGTGHRGGRRGAPKRSGGTGARDASQPRRWGWSGAWAIPWPIVSCESGGDYGAINPSSGAGGAYQILPSTWREYGGTGQPQSAPPSEQDRIAAQIWADSGPAAWVCAQAGNWSGAGIAGSLGPLPDPLPPARRLDPGFLSLLDRIAGAHRVGWATLLAMVRLRGGRGPVPASAAELRRMATEPEPLGGAQRLRALAYFDRAVGRRGLVEGLEAVKALLERRVLSSPRLQIYPGGRADVAAGRVDVRVLTLLLYLAAKLTQRASEVHLHRSLRDPDAYACLLYTSPSPRDTR